MSYVIVMDNDVDIRLPEEKMSEAWNMLRVARVLGGSLEDNSRYRLSRFPSSHGLPVHPPAREAEEQGVPVPGTRPGTILKIAHYRV